MFCLVNTKRLMKCQGNSFHYKNRKVRLNARPRALIPSNTLLHLIHSLELSFVYYKRIFFFVFNSISIMRKCISKDVIINPINLIMSKCWSAVIESPLTRVQWDLQCKNEERPIRMKRILLYFKHGRLNNRTNSLKMNFATRVNGFSVNCMAKSGHCHQIDKVHIFSVHWNSDSKNEQKKFVWLDIKMTFYETC